MRLSDKHRIISSGLGSDNLTGFMVMFLIPNDPFSKEAFSEENYYDSEDYAEEFTILEANKLLDSFLNVNLKK